LPNNAGETMAETRARVSCATDTPRCSAMNLSVNVLFTDEWSNPPGRDTPISLRYDDASIPASPAVPLTCVTTWSATCRIVINYVQHIQKLWDQERTVDADGDGNPDLDPTTMLPINHKCTLCHGPLDAANAAQVPAGQLDLTGVASDEQPLQLRSYRELFFSDNEQALVGGALQDLLVPGPPDEDGNPTQVSVPVGPYLNAGSANGQRSRVFLGVFTAPSGLTPSHVGWMSPAELRLLSEWLDIGAQYFNNPFDPAVPVN
jgi:hypothetical protein